MNQIQQFKHTISSPATGQKTNGSTHTQTHTHTHTHSPVGAEHDFFSVHQHVLVTEGTRQSAERQTEPDPPQSSGSDVLPQKTQAAKSRR